MTIIKSVEEITIFESPDGGKTVYSRKSGSSPQDRTLVYKDPELILKEELTAKWVVWKDILREAKDNPTLTDAIERVEVLYALIKEHKD
jgi:hypothetical protein